MEIQLQQFQTQSLQLIEQVKQTGEEITLTENGKAIAKVVPILPPKTSSFIGYTSNVHNLGFVKALKS